MRRGVAAVGLIHLPGRLWVIVAQRAADVILLVGALGALFDASLAVYHYALLRDRHFTGPRGPLLYYGVPAAVSIALFASVRLSAKRKIVVACLCAVLGVCAVGAEIFLEGQTPPGALPKWNWIDVDSATERADITRVARAAGVSFDLRDLGAVVADLRRAGRDAMPLVAMPRGTWHQGPFPVAAASSRETVLCNESGQWVVSRTDEHGFNNPRGIWTRTSIDVVALGESVTYGYCVSQDRTYVGLIRKSFPATLNLGFSGGPMSASAILREYVVHLKPRTILWFHCEGVDLDDLWSNRDDPVYRRYVEDERYSQGLIDRQTEIDRVLLEYSGSAKASARQRGLTATLMRVENVAKLAVLRERLGLIDGAGNGSSREPATVLTRENLGRFETILADLKTRSAAWGGRVYFVYQPHWDRFAGPSTLLERERSTVLPLARAMGFHVIDVAAEFEAHRDPLALFPFRRFGHYNEAGHRVVAQAVLRVLPAQDSVDAIGRRAVQR